MSVFQPNAIGKCTIQVRIGRTTYGTILRKPTKVKDMVVFHVTVGGTRCRIAEPGGECFIQVTYLPKDIDRKGYE